MAFKCEICKEIFNSEKQMTSHFTGKDHLRIQDELANQHKKIYIGAFPKSCTKPSIEKHFSQYGEVTAVFLGKKSDYKSNFGFVTFKSEDTVSCVLSFAHYIEGFKIIVRACNKSRTVYNRVQDTGLTREEIVGKLKDCKSVEDQMKVFVDATVLRDDEMAKRNEICSDVASVLRQYYPNSQICTYGSTSNGFGLKSSDIDILFEPTPNFWDIDWKKIGGKTNVDDILLTSVDKGLIDHEVLEKQPPAMQVRFLHKILRRNRHHFYKIIFIDARCPIVKLVHKKYSIPCDISCSNRLVLHNTRLLKTFGQLDPRVKPLMFVLRYWAKYVEVVRVGQMSSYAFSLLVIFFLQNTLPPVLPSVMHLRSKAVTSEKVAGWECSFTEDPKDIGPATNQQSYVELIQSFFEFYSNYNFSLVVSPLHGKAIDRESFSDVNDDQQSNFSAAPMCIQDPLECSRNIMAFSNVFCLLKLKEEMKNAASAFKASCDPSTSNLCWGISSLLQERKSTESPLVLVPLEHRLPAYERSTSFVFLFRKDLQDCVSGFERNNGTFLAKVASGVYNMLNHVARFDTEIVDSCPHLPLIWGTHHQPLEDEFDPPSEKLLSPPKENKAQPKSGHVASNMDVDAQSNSQLPQNSKPELLLSVQNMASYNIWHLRNKIKKSSDLGELPNDVLKAERFVTTHLMTDLNKLHEDLLFTCECYFYRDNCRDRLAFLLVPENPSQDTPALFHFLKLLLKDMLNHMLSATS